MLGGAGLNGRGVMPAIARQRLTAFSRSSRSISSFRPQAAGLPARYGRGTQSLTGSLSWRPASSLPSMTAARFNSSSSAAAATTAATATEKPAEAATTAASTTTTSPATASDLSDLSVTDINAIPENIGYLKALGLDYGWGPSSLIEYVIEHNHIWMGLPWWASIVSTGLLVRLLLLKPMLGAADTTTRISNIKHISTPIRNRMTKAASEGKAVEMSQAREELNTLHRQHGVKAWKSFVPLLQIPLGFGCYRVVKGMTALPVPGLAMESVGWIKDLTVADPYFVLPAMTAFFMYLSFKKGGESGANQFTGTGLGKLMLYGLPSMTFAFMAFFPSALQLYFVATGLFALGQSYLLASHGFRKFANIAIPQVTNVPGTPSPAGPGSTGEQQSRALRMLTETLEAESKEAFKNTKPEQRISFIDRAIESLKEQKSKTRQEMEEKMNELRGKAPQTNPDGSPVAGPRLSESDRKLADNYERRRREEEEYKREERNHARRQAHMRALEAEREKAKSSYRQR